VNLKAFIASLALAVTAPCNAAWLPADTLPAIWIPAGGIGQGGLGVVAAHLTADGTMYRWTNNLGFSVRVINAFSYINAGNPTKGPVIVGNLEQPAGDVLGHLNFYVHETSSMNHSQEYLGAGIVVRPGDALTFELAAAPPGMEAVLKMLVTTP